MAVNANQECVLLVNLTDLQHLNFFHCPDHVQNKIQNVMSTLIGLLLHHNHFIQHMRTGPILLLYFPVLMIEQENYDSILHFLAVFHSGVASQG